MDKYHPPLLTEYYAQRQAAIDDATAKIVSREKADDALRRLIGSAMSTPQWDRLDEALAVAMQAYGLDPDWLNEMRAALSPLEKAAREQARAIAEIEEKGRNNLARYKQRIRKTQAQARWREGRKEAAE